MGKPETLSPDRIAKGPHARLVGHRVLVYPTAASTNDLAWSFSDRPDHSGLCVFAEEQTAGRGRQGRRWLSAKNQALLFSVLLLDCPAAAETLTLASAVAVADAIEEITSARLSIKWPNDVLLGGKKACGILTESRRLAGRPCFVIGIGLNVHQDRAFFESANLAATSLQLETGQTIDRNELAARLLNALDRRVEQTQTAPHLILTDWKRRNHQVGQRIGLCQGKQHFHGTCLGVDPAEGLIVQLDDGPIRLFAAAQTSILP